MAMLILDKVSKSYGEGARAVAALSESSLRVQSGEFVAVVGPSGSGKTTMLSIAGALLQPTAGRVDIDGIDVRGLSAKRLADLRLRKIGFVLQSSNLVPFLRVRDQLLVMSYLARSNRDQATRRADRLLAELGLTDRADHYPEALSGGERQRVAIARALMNDPSLILADEPTAMLDSARGRQVVEMLRRLVKESGKAGVMVTHDERMLDLVDAVHRIEDGRIALALSQSTVPLGA